MKLTIIVPVYKVEPYLRRCIDSILAQTFTDFELILVDDGSPDNCPAICDEYAAKDSRIVVIHKENGGLSSARNAGLDIARGEYIGFVDSDDWIHPQMYELLLSAADKENADIVQCKHHPFREEEVVNSTPLLNYIISNTFYGHDIKRVFFDEVFQELLIGVCFKIYRNRVFNTIRFPIGIYYEDLAIMMSAFKLCKKFVIIKNELYYYLLRDNSITHLSFSAKTLKNAELYIELVSYFRNQRIRNQIWYAQRHAMYFYFRDFFAVNFKYKEYKKDFSAVQHKFWVNYYDVLFNPLVCNMQKLTLLMMYLHPKTAYKLCRKYFPECLYDFMR